MKWLKRMNRTYRDSLQCYHAEGVPSDRQGYSLHVGMHTDEIHALVRIV